MQPNPFLDVRHLAVSYHYPSGAVHAVREASFHISQGETLALAGETGSGKSTIAHALLGLLDNNATIESGEMLFEGRNLRSLKTTDWKEIRGRKIGLVFQDAGSALNPVLTVARHLIETLRACQNISRKAAKAIAVKLLKEAGMAEDHMDLYPWELSGGMCQRVGIALGICNKPRLLIADEPTSALDSTNKHQIIELLRIMKENYGLALLIISHDLGLISRIADRIAVLYHGRVIETGLAEEVLSAPGHPYARGLIQSQPSLGRHYDSGPLAAIPGAIPDSSEDFPGCAFAPRCRIASPECKETVPLPREISSTHRVWCIGKDIINLG